MYTCFVLGTAMIVCSLSLNQCRQGNLRLQQENERLGSLIQCIRQLQSVQTELTTCQNDLSSCQTTTNTVQAQLTVFQAITPDMQRCNAFSNVFLQCTFNTCSPVCVASGLPPLYQ